MWCACLVLSLCRYSPRLPAEGWLRLTWPGWLASQATTAVFLYLHEQFPTVTVAEFASQLHILIQQSVTYYSLQWMFMMCHKTPVVQNIKHSRNICCNSPNLCTMNKEWQDSLGFVSMLNLTQMSRVRLKNVQFLTAKTAKISQMLSANNELTHSWAH